MRTVKEQVFTAGWASYAQGLSHLALFVVWRRISAAFNSSEFSLSNTTPHTLDSLRDAE